MFLSRLVLVGLLVAPNAPPTEPPAIKPTEQSIARFEGGSVDLRYGWGEAQACFNDGEQTECFRSESEMDDYLIELDGAYKRRTDDASVLATCATTLRLYTNTSYGTPVLALSTRQTVLNLSTWSFSNVASSYKVGACNSTFYDGANGGAPTYPGNCSAGAQASSMLAGWDNRVSSVYIS